MMPVAMNTPLDRTTASPDDAGEPLDLVFIEGFAGSTVIGIHESELHLPQTVLIDVCAGLARVPACDTDRIADTLDYGELRLRLQRLMSEHGVQLLEALAERGSEGRIAVSARHDGKRASFVISDDGPGIAEGLRQRIFQPFASAARRAFSIAAIWVSRITHSTIGRKIPGAKADSRPCGCTVRRRTVNSTKMAAPVTG